jgi:hypothetical protein
MAETAAAVPARLRAAREYVGLTLEAERRPELVRGELPGRCRVEPPAAGRIDRIVRSALHQAEQTLTARLASRLPVDIAGRPRPSRVVRSRSVARSSLPPGT